MAENILEYRTSLPDQLIATLSSIVDSQRPVSPTRLFNVGSEPNSESAVSPGLVRNLESRNMAFSVIEAEKIQLLNQKISSNASLLPIALKRMEEYMAKIDNLASPVGTIHTAFKRK